MLRTFRESALWVAIILLSAVEGLNAAASLVVLPAEFTLSGSEARQRILVQATTDGRVVGQVADGVTMTTSDEKVVKIKEGFVVPVGNGQATITAKVGNQTATATVTVEKFEQPHSWSFRNHVQPVLSKSGCNMGSCHGALAGKGGFKLSLRGYDPDADFRTLTRQARGRRIVPSDPGRSLMLTKPSGAIPHKGGLRFDVDSLEYRAIAEWIAAGHPAPSDDDARLKHLEILPTASQQKKGANQQMVVRGHFSDGHVEDVTRWCKFTSANATVASVDDRGLVAITGSGEGAISAWYLSQNVIATVSSPYETPVDAAVFANAERSNFIDDSVLAKLKSLNIPPSPRCSDSEFLRRAFLDTIGVLPTADEVRAFLADESPDKRDRLVDQLLTRPEFVDYWAYKWSDLLLLSGEKLRPQALKSFYDFIRQNVADNTPWDEFVRQIVLAKGSTFDNGAANFYSLHQDPLDMAETTSMAFLGMSIQCAHCHDHPLEKWTNNDYYGFASLFARVRGKGWGGDFRSGDGHRVIFLDDESELIQPRTGKPQPPKPLDGQALSFESVEDRRLAAASWLTSPTNPYFSRAIVNRVWANFFGVGLVEKVDDLRLTNPPSNPELLSALAAFLVSGDRSYDLKKMMRLILTSQTYQRSSQAAKGNEPDERFYSRYYPKRLKAEVLLDIMSQVTASPTAFKDFPAGTRAMQLPDANIASEFLKTFGRPERILTCECERSDEPSMTQVLHILNGETLLQKLEDKDNRLSKQLEGNLPPEQLADELFLAALSRFPTDRERQKMSEILSVASSEERRQSVEDLYWSVLSSKEFLFNR
ncbi:S-layer protein [Planctomycetia bacterium]|nr:S-layer protein [Planctomycetia bacterium]